MEEQEYSVEKSVEIVEELSEPVEKPVDNVDNSQIPCGNFVEEAPKKKKSPLRPEWILLTLAVLAGILLLVMFFLTAPQRQQAAPREEDPEAALRRETQVSLEYFMPPSTESDPFEEDSDEETEPESTTIPPERNPYDRYDFQYNEHNYLLLQNVQSYAGVDVSAFQGHIDWEKVADSGIHFAMIRLGYRGYTKGKLVKDEFVKQNLEGAAKAGLKVGAYFFSQATNASEVEEELEFMLKILEDHPLSMPLVLDWEVPDPSARTARMDGDTVTDLQLYFCKLAQQKGYQPMVYFNSHQAAHLYRLHDLEIAPFWLALYQDRMTFPWKVEMWQYSDRGRVPGISGNVDLNIYIPG